MAKNINFQDEKSVAKVLNKMGLIPAYFGYEAHSLIPINRREKLFVQQWILVNNQPSPKTIGASPYSSNFIVHNKIIKDLSPSPDQACEYKIALNTMVQYLGCQAGYAFMSSEWKAIGYDLSDLKNRDILTAEDFFHTTELRKAQKTDSQYQEKLKKEAQNILRGFTTSTSHVLLDRLLDWLMTTEEGFIFHIEAYRKVF